MAKGASIIGHPGSDPYPGAARRRTGAGHIAPLTSPRAYQAIFGAIKLDVAFTIDDVSVDGDTAHALTRSKGKVTVLADGTTTPEENRELFVFGRRDGEWKIIRYMFNKTSA